MLEIKDKAISKLKEIIEEEGGDKSLRIFTMTSCCGSTLMMDLVDKPSNDDIPLTFNDLTIYLHKEAADLLKDAVMDCNDDGEIIIKGLPKPQAGSCC